MGKEGLHYYELHSQEPLLSDRERSHSCVRVIDTTSKIHDDVK
jgi:hypothetical protein